VTAVDLVVPDTMDDPRRPSGGNNYDRRIGALLGARLHHANPASLPAVFDGIADGSSVLVDGLLASPAPEHVLPLAARADLVVLVHMPVFDEREAAVLRAARAVVTTSAWTRDAIASRYRLADVAVARPGVDAAEVARGTAAGGRLLSVGVIARHKGHDVLADALARLGDLAWTLDVVGANDDDALSDRLRRTPRVELTGPLVGAELSDRFAAADLLVLPSRSETYAMVLTEALARAIPVVASDVGGVSEALGSTRDGRPGLLVPPGDAEALARALRSWLTRPELRSALRRAALDRRDTLEPWTETALRIAEVMTR
jgi:glycosyltransferase involved in cell wall biosynthesis